MGVRLESAIMYTLFAIVGTSALAGAFSHMHDWTIAAINEIRVSYGLQPDTADFYGWLNAAISELLPLGSLLAFRRGQRLGVGTRFPLWMMLGSAGLSLLAQLSYTGIPIPGDGVLLAALPALATMVLMKFAFADADKVRAVMAKQHQEAARKTELAQRQRREQAALAAETADRQRREQAALAAELAERERREAAALAREEREHAAELELQRITAQQAGLTERARIEAEARDREQARQAETERAVRVAREQVEAEADAAVKRAEAARIEAEAQAQRKAAELLSASPPPPVVRGGKQAPQAGPERGKRVRRTPEQAKALVAATLAGLPPDATTTARVEAITRALGVSERRAYDLLALTTDAATASPVVGKGGVSSEGRPTLALVSSGG